MNGTAFFVPCFGLRGNKVFFSWFVSTKTDTFPLLEKGSFFLLELIVLHTFVFVCAQGHTLGQHKFIDMRETYTYHFEEQSISPRTQWVQGPSLSPVFCGLPHG